MARARFWTADKLEELRRMYCEECLSVDEIAEKFGVKADSLKSCTHAHGFKRPKWYMREIGKIKAEKALAEGKTKKQRREKYEKIGLDGIRKDRPLIDDIVCHYDRRGASLKETAFDLNLTEEIVEKIIDENRENGNYDLYALQDKMICANQVTGLGMVKKGNKGVTV